MTACILLWTRLCCCCLRLHQAGRKDQIKVWNWGFYFRNIQRTLYWILNTFPSGSAPKSVFDVCVNIFCFIIRMDWFCRFDLIFEKSCFCFFVLVCILWPNLIQCSWQAVKIQWLPLSAPSDPARMLHVHTAQGETVKRCCHSVLQSSFDTWWWFVHPVLLVLSHEALFLNSI